MRHNVPEFCHSRHGPRHCFETELCRRFPHFEKIKLAVVDIVIVAAHQHASGYSAVMKLLGNGVNLRPLKDTFYRVSGRQMAAHVRRLLLGMT